MTIPIMHRAIALACIAVIAGGSFWMGARKGERTRAEVQEASATFTKWEERASALEVLLEEEGTRREDLERRVGSLESRLQRRVRDLRGLLEDVRASTRKAREAAAAAGKGADAAQASSTAAEERMGSLMRELRVLEDRLDVHLRRPHGGS